MKRRAFITASSAAAAAAATAIAPTIVQAAPKKFKWRMALPVPKTLPVWGEAMVKFAELVEKMTSKRLRIKIYGAGELVPPFETFDAVKNGTIEMHQSAGYYYQGKIPESSFFTALPFGLNTAGVRSWLIDGGGQQLWDELLAPHGVKCIPCGSTGYQMAGWYNKKISTVADLKGLKVRIPGIAGKIMARAGATPVLIAGGELFTSLSTGVIDAAEWVGPYHDYIMGFHKAAKYYYSGPWHEPAATLEIMVNKKAWQELPEDLRLMVEAAAAQVDTWIHATWSNKNGEYLEKIKNEGKVEILPLPPEVLRSLKTFSTEVIAELAASSPIAGKIHKSYRSFQKRYEYYQELCELPMIKAFKS